MILSEAAVVEAHRTLMRNGDLGDAFRTGSFGCVDLIVKVFQARYRAMQEQRRIEVGTVLDLGARSVNSCGAAGLLALSGYWSQSMHHLRDMAECTQLFELFRVEPQKAVEFVEAKGGERHKKFRFGAVRDMLRKNPAARDVAGLASNFRFWSNAGSHPSVEGLALMMTDQGRNIGPLIHHDHFRAFTADLWAHMDAATAAFINAVDSMMPDVPPIATEFRFEHAVVTGARRLLSGVQTREQLLATWP